MKNMTARSAFDFVNRDEALTNLKKNLSGYLISPDVIEGQFGQGVVRAVKGDVAFVARNMNGIPVGLEVETFKKKCPNEGIPSMMRNGGFYTIPYQGARTLVVLESAVDVLGYATSRPDTKATLLSINRSYEDFTPLIRYAKKMEARRVLVGFHNTISNRSAALRLVQEFWRNGIYASYDAPEDLNGWAKGYPVRKSSKKTGGAK